MKSESLSSRKGSLFGLSGMWMNTLYRRDLVLAFVAFMAYFSVTILPLILSFNDFAGVEDYYEAMMAGDFNMVPLVACSYPVVLSVILFDYLHNSASAAGMHSFPVTRGKLFRSTLMSGTVLLLAPVLITAVLLFIFGFLMHTGTPIIKDELGVIVPRTLFSASNCMKWFIDTAVGSLFVFALSNLAGIVAGKNVIHALLACLLNSIVGIINVLADMYARAFILGSDGTGLSKLTERSNPFIWYAVKRDGLLSLKDAPMMLMFIAVIAVITVLTGLLYKKIKLEREQDATVFPVVSDLLVIFCSFCVMSVFGIISAEITPGEHAAYPLMPFLFGCIIGGVPAFIVFRMIADSSVRIFKLRTLVNFAAFVLAVCVIFAFTCFDITDQTDRIPALSDVEKVEVRSMAPFNTTFTLEDSQSAEDAAALHKAVLNHKDKVNRNNYETDNTFEVTLNYTLKNGTELKRTYNIDAGKLDDVKAAAGKLASGKEYQSRIDAYIEKVIQSAESCNIYTVKGDINIDDDDIRPLLMAYLKDTKTNGFDYYHRLSKTVDSGDSDFTNEGRGTIGTSPVIKDNEDWSLHDALAINAVFGKKDTNVQKFLKEKGYAAKLKASEKKYDEMSDEE